MNTSCVPRSPKWAASMWLGCFLRIAVRPRAKESMLAEMALMATWLGPAASWMALWFLPANNGEWDPAGAASGREKIREETKHNEIKVFFGLDVWHERDYWKSSQLITEASEALVILQKPQCRQPGGWEEYGFYYSKLLEVKMLMHVIIQTAKIKH